jgi:Mg2+/Co2+ transporter CorB
MPTGDGTLSDVIGILSILLLVAANGFFVAAEFSLVAVSRSRVAQLVAARRHNARALQRAIEHLDSNLAATQLGITISSLALGWLGEPALAHLIEPLLSESLGSFATVGSHAVAITIAFSIITTLHIVLGELAPKISRCSAVKARRFGSYGHSACSVTCSGLRLSPSTAWVIYCSASATCVRGQLKSHCIRPKSLNS